MLDILATIVRGDPQARFGFLAAAMVHETSDVATKRFRIYATMFRLNLDPSQHTLVLRRATSSIFVLPVEEAQNLVLQQFIIERYERIFAETF